MSAERVAVRHDGEVVVHAAAASGGYDTLCGVDMEDSAIGLEPADIPLNGRARIDCDHCRDIWQTARAYTAKDFRP